MILSTSISVVQCSFPRFDVSIRALRDSKNQWDAPHSMRAGTPFVIPTAAQMSMGALGLRLAHTIREVV